MQQIINQAAQTPLWHFQQAKMKKPQQNTKPELRPSASPAQQQVNNQNSSGSKSKNSITDSRLNTCYLIENRKHISQSPTHSFQQKYPFHQTPTRVPKPFIVETVSHVSSYIPPISKKELYSRPPLPLDPYLCSQKPCHSSLSNPQCCIPNQP